MAESQLTTVTFLCGCVCEIGDNVEDLGWWKTVATDRQGFIICVKHNQRRKNWKALPTTNDVQNLHYAIYTPQELEQHFVFGKRLPTRIAAVHPTTAPDLRDNRDPELVGKQYLAQRAIESNGHGHDK